MNRALTQQRIRVTFAKEGVLRFIGHLDLAKTWERVVRRAQMPLEYSQGFNPRPRMQFAAALPVGVTSADEHLDIWLTERLGDGFPEAWIERLNATSPAGLRTVRIAEVDIKDPALPMLVTSAEYLITPRDAAITPDDLAQRAAALLEATTVERVRHNGKVYDLRPLILDLHLDGDHLVARLVTGDQGTGRADELLDALGIGIAQANAHRQRLYLGNEP